MDLSIFNKRWIATFSGAYMKRRMERHYDRLAETSAFQKLKGLNAPTRYGMEAGLYALMAYAEPKLPERTYMQNVFRQLALDAGPELGKRLVSEYRASIERDVIARQPGDSAARETLMELDDEELLEMLQWFSESSPEEREKLKRELESETPEIIEITTALPERVKGTSNEPEESSTFWSGMKRLGERLGRRSNTLDSITVKMDEARKRLDERRRNTETGKE